MDIKTMILMLALGNLTLAAALYLFEYGSRKSFALSIWLHSKQIQALAWILFFGRGELDNWLSIALANSLLFIGIAMEAGAMWETCEHGQWRRYLMPPLALAIGIFCGLFATAQSPQVMVGVASLVVSLFYSVAAAVLLLRWRASSVLARFIGLSTALLALVIGTRAVWAVIGQGEIGLLSVNWVQNLSFISLYLLMLVNGFGFLLLARERQEQQLQRMAVIDPLTDAPNRRGFYNALTPWMALARRHGQSTSLIMFDLDHFKRVNDTYGHMVGDVVLKSVVEIGQKQLRDSDLLGRLGGEEFAVLLPRTNLGDAMVVAERIRQAIMQMPIKTERAMIYVTASLGVTTIQPEDSVVSLFKRADEAMYEAKQGGRNSVKEASPGSQVLA